MWYIILYSTRTGNTKRVAEAICSALPEGTQCLAVREAPPDLSDYDVVFLGFWVDRGTADAAARQVLQRLNGKNAALFATLGAYPDSQHAKESMDQAAACLPEGKKPIHTFICQGKVDPLLTEKMRGMFPAGHPHGMNPERAARLKEAARHPNAADSAAAREFARETARRLAEG